MTSCYNESPSHPLRVSQLCGVLILFGILACAGLFRLSRSADVNPGLEQARAEYEQEKLRYEQARLSLKQEQLPRLSNLTYYGLLSLFGSLNLGILMVAAGFAWAKLRSSSLCSAKIGEHSVIPVRYRDLADLKPVLEHLSLAELEAALSTSHDTAYQLSRQIMQDATGYTRAMRGQAQAGSSSALFPNASALPLPAGQHITPSLTDLLRNRTLAPGTPLVIGYSPHPNPLPGGEGVIPQYRELADLKSLAVAGWQGSGKTRSMAYLIAAAVLTQDVQVFVIDPHKDHPESLSSLIAPLTTTGRVQILNPFDTPQLIARLHRTLDRRLAGQESSEQGIVLVIDELARMAKTEYFDDLIHLLERCTEETRKANITFLGGSPKWTARHFKGRADIRGCMNSMLIHKTKPSQADLLLEDGQEKRLVKELHQPGQAILVTDYAPPVLVTMPWCERQDMEQIAEMIGELPAKHTKHTKIEPQGRKAAKIEPRSHEDAKKEMSVPRSREDAKKKPTKTSRPGVLAAHKDVIPLAAQRQKHQKRLKPQDLTLERIIEQIQYKKQQEKGLTQASIARWAGMSPSLLSRILNGHTALTAEHKRTLYGVLFETQRVKAVNQ
jgi:AraC-like DNA-binding protein